MRTMKAFVQQFNWKIILIRILTNGGALILTALIIPDIYFATRTLRAVLLIAIGLGVLNAIVKPTILFLTGQFIFATFGLLVVLVNTLILYLLEWLFPSILVVNSLFWAIVAGAVLGLISNTLENLLGLTPPIVSDKDLELRKRIEAEQVPSLAALVAKPNPVVLQDGGTQSVSELTAARAALDTLQVATEPEITSQPGKEDTPQTSQSIPPPLDSSQMQDPETLGSELEENSNNTPIGGVA